MDIILLRFIKGLRFFVLAAITAAGGIAVTTGAWTPEDLQNAQELSNLTLEQAEALVAQINHLITVIGGMIAGLGGVIAALRADTNTAPGQKS